MSAKTSEKKWIFSIITTIPWSISRTIKRHIWSSIVFKSVFVHLTIETYYFFERKINIIHGISFLWGYFTISRSVDVMWLCSSLFCFSWIWWFIKIERLQIYCCVCLLCLYSLKIPFETFFGYLLKLVLAMAVTCWGVKFALVVFRFCSRNRILCSLVCFWWTMSITF